MSYNYYQTNSKGPILVPSIRYNVKSTDRLFNVPILWITELDTIKMNTLAAPNLHHNVSDLVNKKGFSTDKIIADSWTPPPKSNPGYMYTTWMYYIVSILYMYNTIIYYLHLPDLV